MTQKETINLYKTIISNLYEKEGRNISYIARLIGVDRSSLSKQIRTWGLIKAQKHHLNPSTQKFINKHSSLIIARMNANIPIKKIAQELNITQDKLYYLIDNDAKLTAEKEKYYVRIGNANVCRHQEQNYLADLPNEEWKEILGFPNYYVSNKGRFKKYLAAYDCFKLLAATPNKNTQRLYIGLIDHEGKRKNLMAARVVAHAFCEGYSEICNTVDHLDMDVTNNNAQNLVWVSQSENNKRKNLVYKGHTSYCKNGKFKELVLNDTFHFKTIRALGKFLKVSETQCYRYINGETKFDGKIDLIY